MCTVCTRFMTVCHKHPLAPEGIPLVVGEGVELEDGLGVRVPGMKKEGMPHTNQGTHHT